MLGKKRGSRTGEEEITGRNGERKRRTEGGKRDVKAARATNGVAEERQREEERGNEKRHRSGWTWTDEREANSRVYLFAWQHKR